ncbi:NUDIX hydrolase [TM7 phylum sp. oral taxon 352]|nr:NUDIX hydrolase [TM7 phylum sp. oral taxon 352]
MTLMTKITNGHIITQDLDGTDHLDCLYRISLKALIYNDAGQILVVKEDGRPLWDLPGGGMDYSETFESALKRELYEEVGYKGNLRYQLFDASDEIYIEQIAKDPAIKNNIRQPIVPTIQPLTEPRSLLSLVIIL